jgi:hypothetical protein
LPRSAPPLLDRQRRANVARANTLDLGDHDITGRTPRLETVELHDFHVAWKARVELPESLHHVAG